MKKQLDLTELEMTSLALLVFEGINSLKNKEHDNASLEIYSKLFQKIFQ